MLRSFLRLLQRQLIEPIVQGTAPISEMSLGVAVGLFVGLTPTMGLQMYLVAMIWSALRLLSITFNLPVGIALVWVTNPITVIPIYYLFLITGLSALALLGQPVVEMSYSTFEAEFLRLSQLPSVWESMVEGTRFLLIDLGWPMVLGSLFYAIPISFLGMGLTWYGLTWHRSKS